jgi:hypothetical protein
MSNDGIARSQERQQRQREADEQQDVDEIAGVVQTHDAENPRDQQQYRNFEEHLASAPQPVARGRERGCAIAVVAR